MPATGRHATSLLQTTSIPGETRPSNDCKTSSTTGSGHRPNTKTGNFPTFFPPSSSPPPAPVTGKTNDDDDAEGSDDPEPEPVHKPAPTTHKKTLSKEEWDVTDEEERKRRRRQKEVRDLVLEPTPAKKSAQRLAGDVGGQKKWPRPEERSTDEESDATDEEERLECRKRKGKGREVLLATEPVKKSSRPVGNARKRHEVKTTRERDISCVRCVKGGRACLEQAGGLVACVYCARIKMRCEPASEEVRSTLKNRNRHLLPSHQ